ncbi:MAG: peptidoglycan recognition family protein [bacterium]
MDTPRIVNNPDLRGRTRRTTNLAVVHAMGERIKHEWQVYDAPFWLQNQHKILSDDRLQVSVHACIRPDGTIVESIPLEQEAWHAKGFNNRSVGCEILVAAPEEDGHNITTFYRAIGIDPATEKPMDLLPPSPYTPTQYQSAGWWYAMVLNKFPQIPPTEEGIRSHEAIDLERPIAQGKANVSSIPAHFGTGTSSGVGLR